MNTSTVIEVPDRAALAAESTGLVNRAKGFVIQNQTDHEEGLLIFRELKACWKLIDDKLKPIIESAHKTHKSLTSLRAELFAPVSEALIAIERKCIEFSDAQKRRAEAEQRRLQEQARKDEEERALMDAIDAHDAGDKATAEEILATPVSAPVVHVEPVIAKVAGVGERGTWSAEVTNLEELVKYVASRPEWVSFLEANMPTLNKMAQAQKGALNIPGVKAVFKRSLSARIA